MKDVFESAYEHIPGFSEMREERAEVLSQPILPYLENGNTVIEIGTGKGDVYSHLTQLYPQQFFSIDIEDQVLSQNDKRGNRAVADGLNLPFANDTFDISLACSMLHHLPHDLAGDAIKEFLRVSSRVIIIEDSLDEPLLGSKRSRAAYVRRLDQFLNIGVPGGALANHRETAEWLKIIQDAGGSIVNIDHFSHPVLGLLPYQHVVYTVDRKS